MLCLNGRNRTQDIRASTDSFAKLFLPMSVRRALALAGYRTPSPIQELCIPLARTGADLIVQAKSGTGKTLVFSLPCLERLDGKIKNPQALILAPTREIALQIEREISKISNNLPFPYLASAAFTGGVSVNDDRHRMKRPCQIVVGTPGRLLWLCQNGLLDLSRIRVFVMDEADQLFAEGMKDAVEFLISRLPASRQTIACSATYTDEVVKDLERMMDHPQKVFLNFENGSLLGVKQTYRLVEPDPAAEDSDKDITIFNAKVAMLMDVLGSVSFYQAIVFCNLREEAEKLADLLERAGFPSAYTSSRRSQEARNEAMAAMRGFKIRVVVSTDLVSRGVDLEHVNLICNLDLPTDQATYQHRIGRTGRFGTFGLSVALVTPAEFSTLQSYVEKSKGVLTPLPDQVPEEWYTYTLQKAAEREAYAELISAPVTPDPMRHFSNEPPGYSTGIMSPEEFESWKNLMTRRDPIWEKWDPYDAVAKKSSGPKSISPVGTSYKSGNGMISSGLERRRNRSSKLLKLPSTLSFASSTSIVYSEEGEIEYDNITESGKSEMSAQDNFEKKKEETTNSKKTQGVSEHHNCVSFSENNKELEDISSNVAFSQKEVGEDREKSIAAYDEWVKAYREWQVSYSHWCAQYQQWLIRHRLK